MRRLPLSVLLPALATLVACGGSIASPDGSSGATPPGGTTGSSGGTTGSSGGTTGSSGGTTGSSGGTSVVFTQNVCTNGVHRPLAGVTQPTGPAGGGLDYIELREVSTYTDGPPRVLDKEGTPCATGPDTETCLAELGSVQSTGWPLQSLGNAPPSTRYAVATAQDSVMVAGTLDALRDLVRPVDLASEAALLVTADGKYRIVCDGTNNAAQTETGWRVRVQSGTSCGRGQKVEEHVIAVTSEGAATVESTTLVKEGDPNCAIGRRPAGLVARASVAPADGDALGRFFAEAAHLEAASVVSFERLARELTVLGAPERLVRAALASRDDEVRHTKATAALARRHGGEVVTPEVAPVEDRTVFAIALENAVEGCVRETYGALVAHWQATHAGDLRIRAVMRTIAEDETRHAELSWDVAAFLDALLTPAERSALERARHEAFAALHAELAATPDEALVRAAGMPRAHEARALLEALDESRLRAAA